MLVGEYVGIPCFWHMVNRPSGNGLSEILMEKFSVVSEIDSSLRA